ncbi:LysR family transcriptional regulator [Vibrio sp. D404a]|uniref:LysR family transcriptional regulator n=1 Tax=unclassified Vibrio TaxID=2614977 RepID=UPI002555B886|nr:MULTISPECIES: LysR family transcriptional regulator [unclassified Vibrio]MDK9738908.1 LysR family transcriptional regulator [Vibrio sp. D404a]MDK9798317.1 LysR family transcriptional regulator [Vibrio sp. D449a]
MDRLNAMRSFVEVATCSSFTQAAEQLGMSRLQVSRHVQEVESWLKQRLLHRTTRKVSLTTAGEAALIRCERILHEAAELEVSALNMTEQLSGVVRISAPIGLTQNLLLDVVEAFTELHPQVTIELFASDRFTQLVDERIDIALRHTDQPDENLIARKLMKIDSVICASPDYLERHDPIKHITDLRDHNCFRHLGLSHWQFVKDNQQHSVEVSGSITANDVGVLVRAACRGKGIVRLPCDIANPIIANGELVPILTDFVVPSSTLWAVYLSRSYQLPVVRQFIDFVAQTWSQDILRPQ